MTPAAAMATAAMPSSSTACGKTKTTASPQISASASPCERLAFILVEEAGGRSR